MLIDGFHLALENVSADDQDKSSMDKHSKASPTIDRQNGDDDDDGDEQDDEEEEEDGGQDDGKSRSTLDRYLHQSIEIDLF